MLYYRQRLHREDTVMIKYKKVNDDFNVLIRFIRFEGDIGPPIHKNWHNSLEIVLQKM